MVSEIYYAVQPVYSYDLVLQMEALFLFSRSLHLVPRLILLFKLSIEFAESTESSLIGAWSLSPDEDVEGEITRDVLPRRRLFKGEGSGGGFTEVGGVRSWLDTVIIHPPDWGLDFAVSASFSTSSFPSFTFFSISPLSPSSFTGCKPNLALLALSVYTFIATWVPFLISYPTEPACILGHLPDRHRLLTHFFILLPGAS